MSKHASQGTAKEDPRKHLDRILELEQQVYKIEADFRKAAKERDNAVMAAEAENFVAEQADDLLDQARVAIMHVVRLIKKSGATGWAEWLNSPGVVAAREEVKDA